MMETLSSKWEKKKDYLFIKIFLTMLTSIYFFVTWWREPAYQINCVQWRLQLFRISNRITHNSRSPEVFHENLNNGKFSLVMDGGSSSVIRQSFFCGEYSTWVHIETTSVISRYDPWYIRYYCIYVQETHA